MTFFDLEGTGPDPKSDRITQLAFLDAAGAPLLVSLVNPGRPIPPGVQALTGVSDEAVRDAPPFRELAGRVAALCEGAMLVGFGAMRYDVPLLDRQLDELGIDFNPRGVIDVGNLFKRHHPRSLADAVRVYLGEGTPEGLHRADADAEYTRRVLAAMPDSWPGLRGLAPDQLAAMSNFDRPAADPAGRLEYRDGVLCYAFGQHRGKPVREFPGFAEWMLARDFPTGTKRLLRQELARLDAAAREPEAAGLFDGNPF